MSQLLMLLSNLTLTFCILGHKIHKAVMTYFFRHFDGLKYKDGNSEKQ